MSNESLYIFLYNLHSNICPICHRYEIFAIEMCTTLTLTLTLTFRMVKAKCKYSNRQRRHDFLVDDNGSICSRTIYEKFANQTKCQSLHWKWGSLSRKKAGRSIWLQLFDSIWAIFFRILAVRQHTYTHLNTHTHSERHGLYLWDKSA